MYCHEKKARQAGVYRPLPPQVRNPFGIRQCVGVVNNKERLVFDPKMSLVQKGSQQKIEMTAMILYTRVRQLHQHSSWLSIQKNKPQQKHPTQTKQKNKNTKHKHFINWAFQHSPSGEPV